MDTPIQTKLYALLSALPGLRRSYPSKIMVVAFIGTHIPLILLIGYLLYASNIEAIAKVQLFLLTLVATLVGTALTLATLHSLLLPVRSISAALSQYVAHGRMPNLPTDFCDEIGLVMSSIQQVIEQLHHNLERLNRLASVDSLTGVYNRDQGYRQLGAALSRAAESGEGFYLGVIDLDRFKPINDTYGHMFGDYCLRHLATQLGHTLYAQDWLARWGGDEFVVGLWLPNQAQARQRFEALLSALNDKPVVTPTGDRLSLVASIGVCQWRSPLDEKQLLAEADRAMYQAKHQGGNRVYFVDDL